MRFCACRSGCLAGDSTGWAGPYFSTTNATGHTVTECVTGDLSTADRAMRAGTSTAAGAAAAGSRWRGSETTITRKFWCIRGRVVRDLIGEETTRWRGREAG